MRTRLAALVLPLVLLAACATVPPAPPGHESCRAAYLGHDARAAAAGVRDGGSRRIPGFPYLRSDRLLASYANEVEDPARLAGWVERLRQRDLEAREAELRNTGWSEPAQELAHLDRCGRAWAGAELRSPQRMAQLRQRAAVPDDYSLLQRSFGLYPLAAPFLRAGVRGYQRDVVDAFAQALPEPAGPLRLWIAAGDDADDRVRRHAPRWLVETASDADLPAAIVSAAGAVDTASPVTYFHEAATRFRGRELRQLVYTTWFPERPRRGVLDPFAGRLDAVVWRVTLDEQGEPLVYDTIHACGCYHYVFAAQPLRVRAPASPWQEMPLQPQPVPPAPFAIRLQAGTHYVQRLVPLPDGNAATYALRPYAQLLSLPHPGGGTRSLFDEDGLVPGSERAERWWLWPSGVPSPGAMRQWGRQATAFVGRRHFDDPFLFEELFE